MAVAIIAAMTFVVVDEVYDFLGENVVWIVITVGVFHRLVALSMSHTCMLAPWRKDVYIPLS